MGEGPNSPKWEIVCDWLVTLVTGHYLTADMQASTARDRVGIGLGYAGWVRATAEWVSARVEFRSCTDWGLE